LREVQAPVAEQSLRQAQVNLDNARSTLRRNQDLFEKNFIGEAALEDSRKAVELADAQVRSARKQVDTAGASGSDTALATAAVAEAQASVQAAHARSSYAFIRAATNGTLIARNVEVGDVVQPGKVLMTLSPAGRTQLVVEIDEKNLRLLALGQKALASADAYPQQRFSAELAYINPGVNAQTGAVEVKLDVPVPPAVIRQDMTVSVDIEVARRAQTLLVSASAVNDGDTAAPWVLRLQDGRALRRPVRLGLRSGGFAEIVEGLQEGDEVIPATAAIEPDARVRTIVPVH
jgi:HlyD family secretion protein